MQKLFYRALFSFVAIVMTQVLAPALLPWACAGDFKTVVVAPDLSITAAEFGAFPFKKGPRDLKGKHVVFKPTDKVKESGFSYGYRLTLKTSRKQVRVFQKWSSHPDQKLQPGDPVDVVDGYIYSDWDEPTGSTKGKRELTVYVEQKPVKKFVYFVL